MPSRATPRGERLNNRRICIAVGGGDQQNGETRAIDDFIVRSSGRTSPRVLFLATATRDNQAYGNAFAATFHKGWGCEVRLLALTTNPSSATIKAALEWAEVVYVGGGDAVFLHKTWNRLGLKPLFEAAWARGVVLSGISAGALCWFDGGRGAYNGYKPLPGLGLVPGTVIPHFKGKPEAVLTPVGPGPVFGVSDRAALVFEEGVYSAWAETPEAGVWRFDADPVRLPAYAPMPRAENAADTR